MGGFDAQGMVALHPFTNGCYLRIRRREIAERQRSNLERYLNERGYLKPKQPP